MGQPMQLQCPSTGYEDLDAAMAQLRSMPGYKVRAIRVHGVGRIFM